MNEFNKALAAIKSMTDNKIANGTSFEEDIYIEGHGVLHYTLSNDLNKINRRI